MSRATSKTPRRDDALTKPAGAFHHGSLRDAAIDLAVREVEAHGHESLSLNHLAHRLGVTGPALYRHFADRHALLREVAQNGYERFEQTLTRAYDDEPDPWRALVEAGLAYVDFAGRHPGWFRLQFHSAEKPEPDTAAAPPRYHERITGALADAFGQTPREVAHVYLGLWAIVHGLATLMVEQTIGGPRRAARNALARSVIELQVDAVRALAKERRAAV